MPRIKRIRIKGETAAVIHFPEEDNMSRPSRIRTTKTQKGETVYVKIGGWEYKLGKKLLEGFSGCRRFLVMSDVRDILTLVYKNPLSGRVDLGPVKTYFVTGDGIVHSSTYHVKTSVEGSKKGFFIGCSYFAPEVVRQLIKWSGAEVKLK